MMTDFHFEIPRHPSWVESDPLLMKIFWPWLTHHQVHQRNDSPQKGASIKRHYKARFSRETVHKKRGPGCWRMHTWDRKSFAWKIEFYLNLGIEEALSQRNIEEALRLMRRYVSLPFDNTENRLWRIAFIYEFNGEIDRAVKSYKELFNLILSENESGGVSLLTYHLVRLAPNVPEHRRLKAEHHIKEGDLRCAVNELQALKRLQIKNGDTANAEKTLNAITALAKELKRKGRLERRGPPEGEFSFDFDEDDQVELDLEDVLF